MIWLNFLIMLILNSCQTAERDSFIIPEGYKGDVTIIFNQKKGSIRKYESRRIIYEIPNDGILITQFSADYGFTDSQYFYIDSLKKIFRSMIGLKVYAVV